MKHTRKNKPDRSTYPRCPDGPKCSWCSQYNLRSTRRRMAEAGPPSMPLPDQKTINGHILIFEDEPLTHGDYDTEDF